MINILDKDWYKCIVSSCPVIGGSDFYGASASDFSSMIVHMNLAKQSERLNGTDVNFARLTCTASLCRDHGVEKYKQVPRVCCRDTIYMIARHSIACVCWCVTQSV